MIHYDEKAKRCNFAHAASLALDSYLGFQVSPERVDDLICDDMKAEWMAYDYDPNSDTMDTCVLDRILDLISLKAFEHEWPRYKDGMTQEELNTFYDKVESFLVDE